MNNNWESLIRAIVPLSFMAIWALTSLFNRDTKPKPVIRPTSRTDGLRGQPPVRSAEPTLRFSASSSGSTPVTASRLPSVRGRDDEGIVILSSETNRLERDKEQRVPPVASPKRATRGKPVVPQRKTEPTQTRTRLAGVSQNVNQHLANSNLELTPLAAMPVVSSLGLTGTTPAAAVAVGTASPGMSRLGIGQNLADPVRLREAFVLNEILQPPVSMRTRRIGPTPISDV